MLLENGEFSVRPQPIFEMSGVLGLFAIFIYRGRGTGEAGEATASLEFRGFTTEKFLVSWIYERGNF